MAQVSTPAVLRIHAANNIVIARRRLVGGTVLEREAITFA